MKFYFQIFTQNKTYVHKKPWIRIVIAALSTIATYRNVKCLLIGKWINKLWYIHTKEYYLEIKGTSSWYTLQYGTSLKHAEWKKWEQSTCVCNSTDNDFKNRPYSFMEKDIRTQVAFGRVQTEKDTGYFLGWWEYSISTWGRHLSKFNKWSTSRFVHFAV